MRTLLFFCRFLVSAGPLTLLAAQIGFACESAAAADPNAGRSLLSRYCTDCHGGDIQEANLRFDHLVAQPDSPLDGTSIERILRAVESGRMPPDSPQAIPDSHRQRIIAWAKEVLWKLGNDPRQENRRPYNRRLTVPEYNFTLQTLFAVDAQFADRLPADPISEAGYDNALGQLGLSPIQIESYLDIARRSVDRYVQFGASKPDDIRYHIEWEDLYYSTAKRYRTRDQAPRPLDADAFTQLRARNRLAAPEFVDPLAPKLPGAFSEDEKLRAAIPKLNQQYVALPERLEVGEMLIRVRAAGTADRDGRYPRMRVEAGITLGDGCSMDKRIVGEVDVAAPKDAPAVYEFRIRLEDVPTKGPLREEQTFDRLSVFDMDQIFISNVTPDPLAIFDLGRGAYTDSEQGSQSIAPALTKMRRAGTGFLHLDCIEIEMSSGPQEGINYRWRVPGEQSVRRRGETAAASDMIKRFMRQAYRRPITPQELDRKLKWFDQRRAAGETFERSLKETLTAVLVSPAFLFLSSQPPEPASPPGDAAPTAYPLASRLSYLLWLSPPDEQLLKHAADGSLAAPEVMHRQAKRLIADPRSRRMMESFCRQWLRLDRLRTVAVDRETYPRYDEDLAADAVRETLQYFSHVFRSGASALDLIDSDYAILNDRLARHYDIGVVTSGDFRKVRLPAGSVRGGFLTQASILTMNSDGVDSHPIRRGAWLLDRILNDPPPPPPPNVPQLPEAGFQEAGLSLKQRIELHRGPSACSGCHRNIDPWGLAMENFDATGRWRDRAAAGPPNGPENGLIDARVRLPDGRPIDGITDLKNHLRRQRKDQFLSSVVYHFVTFAIGRAPDYRDRGALDQIQKRFADANYRLDELVLATIDSPLFRPVAQEPRTDE